MSSVNSQVLRNLGVPITVAEVVQRVEVRERDVVRDGEIVKESTPRISWVPAMDGDRVIERRTHLRLNNNAVAALEGHYGSMEAFQEGLEVRQAEGIRLAMCAGMGLDIDDPVDVEMVGAMILSDQAQNYAAAVGTAMAMANGMDPTSAVALWEESQRGVKTAVQEMGVQVNKMVAEEEAKRTEWEALSDEERDGIREMTREDLEAIEALDLDEEGKAALRTLSPVRRAPEPVEPESKASRGKSGSDAGSASDEPTPSSGT